MLLNLTECDHITWWWFCSERKPDIWLDVKNGIVVIVIYSFVAVLFFSNKVTVNKCVRRMVKEIYKVRK